MKNTGMVRRLDPLGRIVLPKELRECLNLKNGEGLQIFTEGDNIVLKPQRISCVICGEKEMELLAEIDGVCLCRGCAQRALSGRSAG